MAEFSGSFGGFFPSLAVQSPDVLGSYMGGLERGYELQFLPYRMALAGQEYEKKGLDIEQARMALGLQQAKIGAWQSRLARITGEGGTQDTGPGSPSNGRSEGVYNGPHGAVSANTSPLTGPQPGGAYTGAPPAPVATPTGMAASGAGYGQVSSGALSRADQTLRDLQRSALTPQEAENFAFLDPQYLEAETKARDYQLRNAQFEWGLNKDWDGEANLRFFATSPNAGVALARNDPNGIYRQSLAQRYGLDFNKMVNGTPNEASHEVNKAFNAMYNEKAIARGMTPLPLPEYYGSPYDTGFAGAAQIQEGTNKVQVVQPQQLPSLSYKELHPMGGGTEFIPQMTGGASAGQPSGLAPGGPVPGIAATAVRAGRPPGGAGPRPPPASPASPANAPTLPQQKGPTTFYEEPTPEQLNYGVMASRIRTPKMEVQKAFAGTNPPLFDSLQRDQFIKALAPDDGPSLLEIPLGDTLTGAARQKIQELSFKDPAQAKLAMNLVPVLQAAAAQMPHSARGGTDVPALRAMIETMVPRSKEDIPTAMRNMDTAYQGVVAASGTTPRKKEYRNTLGIDRQVAESGGRPFEANGKTYVQMPDGKVFKVTPYAD